MPTVDDLKAELTTLVEEGAALANDVRSEDRDVVTFSMKYQSWYSRALEAVDVFLPTRAAEFRELYRPEKRKEMSVQTYGISDFLLGFTVTRLAEYLSSIRAA